LLSNKTTTDDKKLSMKNTTTSNVLIKQQQNIQRDNTFGFSDYTDHTANVFHKYTLLLYVRQKLCLYP